MLHSLKKILLFVPIVLFANFSFSQGIDEFLERYTADDAEKYVQPLSDAVGSDMNSAWYHSAYIRKKGFQLDFTINAMSALVPDKKKTFSASTPDFFTPKQSVTVPTILGPPENVIVNGANGTNYAFPGGVGASMVPLAIPQITIGSFYGTQASVRWVGYDFSGDVGKIELFGWGVRHSISQYLQNFPVNIAVGYYSTKFDLSDDLSSTHQFVSLQGSYSVSNILELYGGLGYESGTFKYTYFSSTDDVEVTIDIDPQNSIRFTIGATLNLGAFTMNLDYNLADQSAVSAGIGVGFGKKKKTE